VALRFLGLRDHAAHALADVDADARTRLEPAIVVALAVEEAAVFSGLEGRADDALAALAAARLAVREAVGEDSTELTAALDVAGFEVLLGLGRHRELLVPLEESYRRGPEAGRARWAAASAMYAEALAITGRQQEALRILAELGPIADDPTLDLASAAVVRASTFGCLIKCGLWRDALGLGATAPVAGRESLITGSVLDTVVGTLHLYSGRTADALPALLAAHSQARVRDLYLSRGQIVAALAWTSALLGDAESARRYLEAYGAGQHAPFSSAVSAEFCAYSARLVLGDQLEAQVLDRARAHLDAGHAMEAVLLLSALARRGSRDAIDLLRTSPIEQPGPLAVAITDYAEGTVTGDATILLRAAELLAHLGNDGFAAEAAAAAAAVPGADRSIVRQAQRLAQDSRKNLGLATAVSAPELLSAREQEVADLAAHRLSNQEIADRLHLSVRTVESYLQSAFGKLGINSRADLPDLLSA
jgi:DNA-binding CsgD family transcriptional regulator